MELVPILSTIILVGTIATFILAVAAYILYKIRERRAREDRIATTQFVQEPHVLVAPQQTTLSTPAQQVPATNVFVAPSMAAPVAGPGVAAQPAAPEAQSSLFWEYTDEGFVPVQPDEAGASASGQDEQKEEEGFAWL